MLGVLVDPHAQVLIECERPDLEYLNPIQVGDLLVHPSKGQFDAYFIIEGHQPVLRGVTFIPEVTYQQIAEIIDFGSAVEVGHTLMFFGNCNVREIRLC